MTGSAESSHYWWILWLRCSARLATVAGHASAIMTIAAQAKRSSLRPSRQPSLGSQVPAACCASCSPHYPEVAQCVDHMAQWRYAWIARYNKNGGTMNNDEMDAALMVFVNCLGAVIMVSVVGFHYLTAKPKDADL